MPKPAHRWTLWFLLVTVIQDVSLSGTSMVERIEAEQQSYDPDRFAQALFESAPDAILVVNGEGQVIKANAQAEAMFGYSREELSQQAVELLLPERFRDRHGLHRKLYANDPRIRQMGSDLNLSGRRKDGTEFPVDIMLSPLRAGSDMMVIAMVRDISVRKAAEEALHRTEEQFRLLVSGVQDHAMFFLSPTGNIVTWNAGAQRIKGYDKEEVLGKHLSLFYVDEDRAAGKPEKALETAIEEGHFKEEGWRKRKDGSLFWASVSVTPLRDSNNNLVGFAKVTRDVSERKNADDHIQQLMHQREDFVAMLAHDLKTPVLAANQAIKLLLEGDFGPLLPEQSEILQTIVDSNQAMYRLLVTLLDVYRYDSGAKQLAFSMHDLSILIDKLLQETAPIAQSKNVSVQSELVPGPILAFCDQDEIRRVLQNLLDNALKFTRSGGSVHLQMQQSPESTLISVKDTGKGISEEDQAKLFERFWAPPASGRHYASTGLGLYLCRKIVEKHGGKIWFESKLGSGSTFYFTIANQKADQPDAPENAESKEVS